MTTAADQDRITHYARHCEIRITTDRAGRRIAHSFGRARRWLNIPLAFADLVLAEQEAQRESGRQFTRSAA